MPYGSLGLLREFAGPSGDVNNVAGPSTAGQSSVSERGVFLGNSAGENNGLLGAPADDVVMIGFEAGQQNVADSVIAIGTRAAQNNTLATRDRIIAIGTNALAAVPTTGLGGYVVIGHGAAESLARCDDNGILVIGDDALNLLAGMVETYGNTIVGNLAAQQSIGPGAQRFHGNTALGHGAMQLMGTVADCNIQDNVAIGFLCMQGTPSGQAVHNVAIGPGVMEAIDGGVGNVGIGGPAGTTAFVVTNAVMENLTSGDNNVAIGRTCMTGVTTGSENIAVGSSAMDLVQSGTFNTAVGFASGLGIPSAGVGNTCLGWNAGGDLTLTNRNVIIGQGAGQDSADGADQLIIETRDAPFLVGSPARSLIYGRFDTGSIIIGGNVDGGGDPIDRDLDVANMTNGVKILNGVAPVANPVGGGFLFVTAGALNYRGSTGTVTALAVA